MSTASNVEIMLPLICMRDTPANRSVAATAVSDEEKVTTTDRHGLLPHGAPQTSAVTVRAPARVQITAAETAVQALPFHVVAVVISLPGLCVGKIWD